MNGYELLIVWFLTVLMSTLSLITLTLVTSKVRIIPDLELAKRFISWKLNNSTYNYDYLIRYLSIHLVKYNDGKLPAQPGTIVYSGDKCQYTLNFYNATDERIVKYIKSAVKLLKEKPGKKMKSVIEQCEDVIKATPVKRVRRQKQLVSV